MYYKGGSITFSTYGTIVEDFQNGTYVEHGVKKILPTEITEANVRLNRKYMELGKEFQSASHVTSNIANLLRHKDDRWVAELHALFNMCTVQSDTARVLKSYARNMARYTVTEKIEKAFGKDYDMHVSRLNRNKILIDRFLRDFGFGDVADDFKKHGTTMWDDCNEYIHEHGIEADGRYIEHVYGYAKEHGIEIKGSSEELSNREKWRKNGRSYVDEERRKRKKDKVSEHGFEVVGRAMNDFYDEIEQSMKHRTSVMKLLERVEKEGKKYTVLWVAREDSRNATAITERGNRCQFGRDSVSTTKLMTSEEADAMIKEMQEKHPTGYFEKVELRRE